MNNNDRLVRLRYALDLNYSEMVDIFNLGKKDISLGEIRYLLLKEGEKRGQDIEESENRLNS